MSTIMAQDEVGSLFDVDALLERDMQLKRHTWIHFPPRSVGRIVLTNEDPFRFQTHFGPGRPVFCWGHRSICSRCADGDGFKAHYAVSAYDVARRCHGTFQFTPDAWRDVRDQCIAHGSRLGFVVGVTKDGGVKNGKLCAEVLHQYVQLSALGEACDTLALIMATYRLQLGDLDPEALQYRILLGKGVLSTGKAARGSNAEVGGEKSSEHYSERIAP